MTPAASHVLLLGWDDFPRAAGQPTSPVLPVAQALGSHLPLAVVLLHRPASPLPIGNAHLIVLAELTPQQLQALPLRPDHAAGWQAPAAPYVGSSADDTTTAAPLAVPAAPYAGSSLPAPTPYRPTSDKTASASAASDASITAPAQRSAPVTDLPAGGLLNQDTFAEEGAEPDAAEAHDLVQPQDDLSPDVSVPAQPVAPATAPVADVLPEGLAALQLDPAPDVDLNYQVIQYARLASRQVVAENFGVIYATDWPTWLAGMEIRQQTGRPLVLHVHSLAQDRDTPADRGWIQELERLAMRRADLVLASSAALAEQLQATYPAVQRLQVVAPTDTDTLYHVLSQL